MSPRPYRMGKRDAATSQTRTRILEAARQLLAGESETDLSMEAIARQGTRPLGWLDPGPRRI